MFVYFNKLLYMDACLFNAIDLYDDFYTGCLAILEELQDGIAKTDQKETLQVGSYRINPDGTQNLKQVGGILTHYN